MSQTIIPIVFSCDNNFAKFLDISIISLLENTKNQTNNVLYDIYCLIDNSVTKKNISKIQADIAKYKNYDIHFINLEGLFKETKSKIKRISHPTYYRLVIANQLPEKYNKCIYLDTDILILNSLEDLFNHDIENYYLGGIRIPNLRIRPEHILAEFKEKTKLPSLDQYINAGVVLMNLDLIRNDNITQKFVDEIPKYYPTLDQDILNIVAYNKIRPISPKYNAMVPELSYTNEELLKTYSQEEIDDAKNNPTIIHYIGSKKPWLQIGGEYWKYVFLSSFKKEIYLNFLVWNIKNIFKKVIRQIFSVKNSKSKTHKIITILGIKFTIKKNDR